MAQADFIQVNADIDSVQNALKQTAKSIKSIQRQTIAVMAKGTIKCIKTGIAATTERHTGELLKCYGYRVKKDGSQGSVYPRGEAGSKIFPKVFALNYGDEIRNHPRGFIEMGSAYLDAGLYGKDLEQLIDKELKKYWG